MQHLIVFGVGTGVGKTWVASALARSALPQTCLALKPIETGCTPGEPPSDAAALASAAGHPLHAPRYSFAEPVTPWLAAEHEGKTIDLEAIRIWVDECTTTHGATLHATTCIVETAGGVFSPLSAHVTNLELGSTLEPASWILVAPNRLGVLHDVRATVAAMDAIHRPPDLIMLNDCCPPDASTGTNLALLRRLHPNIPILTSSSSEPPTLASVTRQLERR